MGGEAFCTLQSVFCIGAKRLSLWLISFARNVKNFLTIINLPLIINYMKTIGLSGIIVGKVCGFGKEREKPQQIEIDVKIETDFTKVAKNDSPDYGIDLNTIYDLVTLALQEEVYTIETISYRVWEQLKNLDSAGKVKVRVRKRKPPCNGEVEYSEAIIEE